MYFVNVISISALVCGSNDIVNANILNSMRKQQHHIYEQRSRKTMPFRLNRNVAVPEIEKSSYPLDWHCLRKSSNRFADGFLIHPIGL